MISFSKPLGDLHAGGARCAVVGSLWLAGKIAYRCNELHAALENNETRLGRVVARPTVRSLAGCGR